MVATQPTLSIFSGTEGLGTFFSEQNQINVKFVEDTLAFSDTTGNFAFNIKGKVRYIIIQGAHDGTGFTGATQNDKLSAFVTKIEEWVRGKDNFGNVQATITYTNGFGKNFSVKAFDWSWRRSFNDPNRILYSLLMHEV